MDLKDFVKVRLPVNEDGIVNEVVWGLIKEKNSDETLFVMLDNDPVYTSIHGYRADQVVRVKPTGETNYQGAALCDIMNDAH